MGGALAPDSFPDAGTRKPAVPLGGKYRLVDIPISNCLNGGFSQIYVLTQFNSTRCTAHQRQLQVRQFSKASLRSSPPADPGGCELVPGHSPTPCAESSRLLEPSLRTFSHLRATAFRMELPTLLQEHLSTGPTSPWAHTVDRRAASGFGIMHSDADRPFTGSRKTQGCGASWMSCVSRPPPNGAGQPTEASFTGVDGYLRLQRQILIDVLDNKFDDFGKHHSSLAAEVQVFAYIFQGIGKISAQCGPSLEANWH